MATTFIAGLVWGSSALFLFADDIVHQTLLVFVLGGITLGSVFTLSAFVSTVASFVLPALLPVVLRLATEGEPVYYAMATMVLLFTISMVVGTRATHAIILNSLKLRDVNASQGAELVRQQNALSERASRLQAILDNTVDSIITVNDRGYIEGFNRAAEHVFGYRAAQVLEKPLAVLLPPQSGSVWRESWDRCLDTCRKPGAFCELTLMRQDGSTFPVELTLSCVQQGEGSVYVGIFRDISERKRMERLKNEFISTVSHELRTPLTSIRGSLGLVSGGAAGPLPERATSLVAIAAKNSERLARLIDDILDIERLESGAMRFDFAEQDLMPLVEEAIASNAGYGEMYNVSLGLVRSVGEATVIMDADRIAQVLANLLSNAIKFSPQDGRVEISVERHGDAVRVGVADHGPGIPVGFRPRVFQKFAQADASDERANTGTGLGLSISRAIIEQHGGRMGFETELNVGTTFWFELGVPPGAMDVDDDFPDVDPEVAGRA